MRVCREPFPTSFILYSFTLHHYNQSLQPISTYIYNKQQEVPDKVIEEKRELMPWDLVDVDRKEAPKSEIGVK